MPRPFVEADRDAAIGMTREAGFGHLVAHAGGEFVSSPMPFVIDDDGTTLRGHLAKANPLLSVLPAPSLVIVPVTDAYISPSWYPSKHDDGGRVVPTWNYEIVHLRGELVAHDRDWTLDLVRTLTDRFESPMDAPWSVDDAPPDYIDKLLGAIVGVSLAIERVDAKRKLSQNKSAGDAAGAAAGLEALGGDARHDVADAMRRHHPEGGS